MTHKIIKLKSEDLMKKSLVEFYDTIGGVLEVDTDKAR